MKRWLVLAIIAACPAWGIGQVQNARVAGTAHNLSASGPGTVKATTEQEICIFCHTPHNASMVQPLWNRMMPVGAYKVYSSNSLHAVPGQPTGSSKLCLSCHDGTIALGSVLSRNQPIAMAGGITTLPAGKSNLGTDLSDDHPISFKYDSALATKNLKLKDPSQLPPEIKLDKSQELQCTSCHDAHNNQFGKFLVMDNSTSQLCTSCHNQGTTTVANHVQCAGCHQQHSAPSGPYLLRASKVSETCLLCHSGGSTQPQGANLAADLTKMSKHDTSSAVNLAEPFPDNVSCADCHEPHTMTTTMAAAPNVPGNFGQVSGVSSSGTPVPVAQFEYEVCYKCHADKSAMTPLVSRKVVQTNLRLKFDPSAISFHPVQAAGKNTTSVPSLKPGLTTSSIIYCNDCHNSDTGTKAGGAGPNGVHGSTPSPLLIAGYNRIDNMPESDAAYALCYKCHDRVTLLSDSSSFKSHSKHVSEKQTSCSACHDPHGIASAQGNTTNNSHLINFDTSVVQPVDGRLEYQMISPGHGNCFLSCHGVVHNPKSY